MKVYGIILLIIFYAVHTNAQAQPHFPNKKYPAKLFRNPLSTPFSLVGNFGECRPNHFHSGIDIRTDGKENKKIYAIEDGYISRVKIEESGFGNAIYINHASGYTSVYAHLNTFYPALENFIKKKQYASKSWKIDMTFFPDQFWVRKGDFIALSGNTGSSQGPHLHLEIRNALTEAPLNPLLFFNEIQDITKPVIKQLAVYDGSKSIYEQSPQLFKVNKGLLPKKPIEVQTDKVFVGIEADDYMAIAKGNLGIYEMRLYVDDEWTFAWQMDNISYDITNYLNAHTDYKTRKNKGPWIQLCTQLPNDKLSIYQSANNNHGMIDLSDGQPKDVRIVVYDTKYNSDTISFVLQSKSPANANSCSQVMKAGKKNTFKNEDISFTLQEQALYDDICFKSSIKNSDAPYSHIYQIHYSFVPVHTPFDLMLRPKKEIPEVLKNKIAMVRTASNIESSKKGIAATYTSNYVMAKVKEFGNYEIVIDQKAPQITTTLKEGMSVKNMKAIYFNVKEETTTIKSCTALLDGQWLRLVQKGSQYYYTLDEYFPKGTHQLLISATDENNNTSIKKITLTR
jgi:hypothetical protein